MPLCVNTLSSHWPTKFLSKFMFRTTWWWWWWIVFVVWLTDESRLALFPAGTIVRDPHHCKFMTRRNVSSILQMHDSKFLLYLKSAACQYLLPNKKSVFKVYPYKTWLLIKYCHIQDVLEWQFPNTIMYVHFHALCMSTFNAQSKQIFQRNYIP